MTGLKMERKHVLITGGNKGIGLETSRLFLDRGFKVTVIARDFSAMQKSDYCNLLEFDLQNIEKIRELVSKLGDIDVLVNNAGLMNTYSYDNYPENEKSRLLKVNLEASSTRGYTKAMEERAIGHQYSKNDK